MKKLMIAAFAAAACVVTANAYTVTWGFGTDESVVDSSGAELTGGTAMLFALSGEGNEVSFSADGGWNLNGAQLVDTHGYDDGTWGNYDGLESSVSNLGANPNYFQILMLEDSDVTDILTYEGKYVSAVTDAGDTVYSTDPSHAGEIVGYDFLMSGNIAKGDWQTAAVPEPTSGLLLLLGVAGLALRRRRA